jgi:hypothetical protein
MTEQLIIARIRAMTDPAEVDKQLQEVHSAYLEVTSHVRSALADVRERFKASSLFTEEDLHHEVSELKPATELQMTFAHYEEELRKKKEELKGKK